MLEQKHDGDSVKAKLEFNIRQSESVTAVISNVMQMIRRLDPKSYFQDKVEPVIRALYGDKAAGEIIEHAIAIRKNLILHESIQQQGFNHLIASKLEALPSSDANDKTFNKYLSNQIENAKNDSTIKPHHIVYLIRATINSELLSDEMDEALKGILDKCKALYSSSASNCLEQDKYDDIVAQLKKSGSISIFGSSQITMGKSQKAWEAIRTLENYQEFVPAGSIRYRRTI